MRADEVQRRFLEAHHGYWNSEAAPGGMLDAGHMFVWTWDARAYPSFPENIDLFADGTNWLTGHWLNGRLGAGTLSSVIAAILKDNGIEDFDVSGVSGDLKGFVMGSQASARDLIEPLATAFRLDAGDVDGTLQFQSRGLLSLPAAALEVFADLDDQPRWQELLGQDGDFAGEAILDFQQEVNAYEAASARSRRLALANDRILRVALPAVLDEDCAGAAVEGLLRDHRLSRRQVSFALPPNEIGYEPGDVVSLPEAPDRRLLITRIEDGAVRSVEARETGSGDSAGNYGRLPPRRTERAGDRAFAPLIYLMDLPRYRDGAAEDFAAVAVTAKPWRRVALSSSPEHENYDRRAVVTRPASTGRLKAALAAGPLASIDSANQIRVALAYGGLQSVSQLALLNGANRLAVRAANGGWEIIGFGDAEEIAADTWRLSGLLRGLAGTGDAMAAGALIDAPVVMLDQAVMPLGLKAEEAGLTLNWIAEAFGAAGGRAGPIAFAGGLRAETPLAPVHLSACRMAEGDIAFNWIRCSRIGGDGWSGDDIPLDEAAEAYRLQIFDGETILRTVSIATSAFTYDMAAELADFGATQSAITFEVRQKGARVALGIPARKTVTL